MGKEDKVLANGIWKVNQCELGDNAEREGKLGRWDETEENQKKNLLVEVGT